MRIYEFAKQSGISNKDLLELLRKGGFPASTHMAALTDEALTYLENILQKKAPAPAKKAEADTEKKVTTSVITEKPIEKKIEPEKIKPAPQPSPRTAPPPVARPTGMSQTYFKKEIPPQIQIPTSVLVEPMTVEQAAQRMGRSVSEVILSLLKKGMPVTKNQQLNEKIIADLARSYGLEVNFPGKKVEVAEKKFEISQENLVQRMPVIVVMGHVDHGKTTLLDYIRKTRVAAKEKGGITQHLGAYQAETAHGNLVFLDTPGHESFSKIRMRGVKAADVAILVVAADDSVKPQTIEALSVAKAMQVPIVVAVNKIDKVDPQRVDVVKRDLMAHDLVPEEWGGSTIYIPISAKLGTGVDQLLEIIALQAEIMELKANPEIPARGFILESRLEKGLGPIATIICQEGTLRVGDYFICGATQGKVTGLIDTYGKRVQSVGPSMPILVAGFDDLADVGEVLSVVDDTTYKKARSSKGERRVLMPTSSAEEGMINVIIKADSNATKEALLGSLYQLNDKAQKGEKKLYIVSSGVGDISESDILLASHTGSSIIGLHARLEPNAVALAQKNAVQVKNFDIIYHLLESTEMLIKGSKEAVMVKQKIGEAVVRKVFDIKDLGVIAGSYIKDGKFVRDGLVVIWRDNRKVGQGKIKSLQREKRSMKEVLAGFECGFIVDGFNDWQVDDRVECFIEVPSQQ